MKEEVVYKYRNRDASVAFETVRFEGKEFRQRRYGADGKHIYNLNGVFLVPYRLDEWRFKYHDQWLFIPEGEKDCDRLWKEGLVATTNPLGAGKWKEEYNSEFARRRVCLLPDNDSVGHAHVKNIATNLLDIASEVKILKPPGLEPGGDISDWFKDHSRDELLKLADCTSPVTAENVEQWKADKAKVDVKPIPRKKKSRNKEGDKPSPAEETLIPLERDLTNEEIKELTEMEITPDEVFLKASTFIEERVGLPAGAKELLALWAMNSYTQMVFDVFPYVLVESVTHGLGKTTVMEILNSIVYKGEIMVAPTPASIYEGIDCGDFLTAFLDEFDQVSKESKQEITGLLNNGYKKGGTVSRQRGKSGMSSKRKKFKVGCQKMFASIGGLRNALLDRCIVIHMQRVYRTFKSTNTKPLKRDSAPIKKLLQAYALQNGRRLEELYEHQPDETYFPQFKNREAELFASLLMHTRLMSQGVADKVLKVASIYSTSKQNLMELKSDSLTLIREFHDALNDYPFNLEGTETFRNSELIQHLLAYGDGWAKRLKGDKDNMQKDVSKITDFLKGFNLPQAKRARDGSHHEIELVVQALAQALPQELQHLQQSSQPADNNKDNGVAGTSSTATETAAATV